MVTQHGRTALHEALSSTGNGLIVKSLLIHGADPNAAPKVNYTVIHNYGNPWFLLNNSVKHWPILVIYSRQHYKETCDCSLAHLTLILSLHYLMKCRSRSLAIYNNEFILGNTCVVSEMINLIVTNTSNTYYISKSHTCFITLSVLQHVLKMSFCSTNVSGRHWCHSPTACSITHNPEQLTRCWCIISVRRHTILKWIS